MKVHGLIFYFFILAVIIGCDEKNFSGLNVTGKVGEILVVCDDAIWQKPLTNELDTALTQFIMPYWPDVATFELVHRNSKTFEGAIKRHRNILFLTVDKTLSKPSA